MDQNSHDKFSFAKKKVIYLIGFNIRDEIIELYLYESPYWTKRKVVNFLNHMVFPKIVGQPL